MQVKCFHCQHVSTFETKIGFREECAKCRSDLHACKNCEFYDKRAYNECREPSAEVVREKERSNYCDFFQARSPDGAVVDEKAKLKAAAEALFKKN
jgi:hypothetical protein